MDTRKSCGGQAGGVGGWGGGGGVSLLAVAVGERAAPPLPPSPPDAAHPGRTLTPWASSWGLTSRLSWMASSLQRPRASAALWGCMLRHRSGGEIVGAPGTDSRRHATPPTSRRVSPCCGQRPPPLSHRAPRGWGCRPAHRPRSGRPARRPHRPSTRGGDRNAVTSQNPASPTCFPRSLSYTCSLGTPWAAMTCRQRAGLACRGCARQRSRPVAPAILSCIFMGPEQLMESTRGWLKWETRP